MLNAFQLGVCALNALYLLLAAVGLALRPRFSLAMLAYMLLRSALLLTVEAPETRTPRMLSHVVRS